MSKQILIIQGHPDMNDSHYCHALAQAYWKGAEEAGHTIELLEVAQLDFPVLRNEAQWRQDEIAADQSPTLASASADLRTHRFADP